MFAKALLLVENVADSTLDINANDFSILDESGTSYSLSSKGLSAHLGKYITLTADAEQIVAFEDYSLKAGNTVHVLTYYDIPRTGFERKLEIRFQDTPLVPLYTATEEPQ